LAIDRLLTGTLPECEEEAGTDGSEPMALSDGLSRRLLVVSFHAPPDGAVGGLRWWGLSRQLARRGWSVRMITAADGPNEMSSEGIGLRRVPPSRTLNDRYSRWRQGYRPEVGSDESEPSAPDNQSNGWRFGSRAARVLRREVGGLLSFPDGARGWVFRALVEVRNSTKEFRPDVVISTGPPHSVHLAVGLALRGTGVPWLADFRDPWADEARLHQDVAWACPVIARFEAWVGRSADGLLTTTPELATVFRKRFPAASVQCLPNGVDTDKLPARSSNPFAGLSIVHLGTLYHRRDPIPVIRAFGRFLRRHEDARADSRIRLVGHTNPAFCQRIAGVAEEEGLADQIELVGRKPRKEALAILARSSLSLVLAQKQGTAVPAKIYESVAMGIPTLAVTEPTSATANAARRLGAAAYSSEDIEGMAEAMADIWKGRWNGGIPQGTRVTYADLALDAEALLMPLTVQS